MDVKDLRFFVAAYEAKSFSGATSALGTVQSNVSLRIRNLEEFVGAPLFVRLRRSVVPTTRGDLLYQHAKNVIATLDETERAVCVERSRRRAMPRPERAKRDNVNDRLHLTWGPA